MENKECIQVYGARVHNLKNIDVAIPRNKLTVITGMSGSGKSSLAFDTIYAEGRRRYLDTMSSYARQFIGTIERPDVDKITGLSPVIAIEQKTTSKNPRSTVGTITEIYDFLRLLYARVSDAYSYLSGEKMVKYSDEKILRLIKEQFATKAVYVLAPVVRGRKGHYKELFEQIRKKGFLSVRIDGQIKEVIPGMKIDRYKSHDIEIVVDKLVIQDNQDKRLTDSFAIAMQQGKGVMMIMDKATGESRYYSRKLMCPVSGISYDDPAPHSFSFNSPRGACPVCNGLGEINEIDVKAIIPDTRKSIKNGAIEPLGTYRSVLIFWQIEAVLKKYGADINTPVNALSDAALHAILYGSDEVYRLQHSSTGISSGYMLSFDGVVAYLHSHLPENMALRDDNILQKYIRSKECPECKGMRLKRESLHFLLHNKNISELSNMDIVDLYQWFVEIEQHLSPKEQTIARDILKEIRSRIVFLLDVGLGYLSLNRPARTLSGGESQRIRLATQIGAQLVNVLYILDEPSIGLHQKDNQSLIRSLKKLRDTGNTIIVVEHDKDMILSADYVVDMGPKAGKNGGEIVSAGRPDEIIKASTLTGMYLSDKKKIVVPSQRRSGNGKYLTIEEATGNNLQKLTVRFPLGMFICVTGVSGSGKSSLINETLYPALSNFFYRSSLNPLPYKKITGIEHINKVIDVDQSPLGRTPRSNPATYIGLFTDIRKLFEQHPESKIRGFKASRFSFNVSGGRCEECKGAGVQTIEMNFLPDVFVPCKSCNGKRYNKETLEVLYKGKSISDVLDMTVSQACDFFVHIRSIFVRLQTLQEVGLGYLSLGQASTTLSGGESQRVKLAAELSKRDTGKTLYILDEPTTGLHFEDVKVLLDVLTRLTDKGNTMIVIEHNMEVIKMADYIIDMGPEGGKAGGRIVAEGTPEQIVAAGIGYTAKALKAIL